MCRELVSYFDPSRTARLFTMWFVFGYSAMNRLIRLFTLRFCVRGVFMIIARVGSRVRVLPTFLIFGRTSRIGL